MVKNDGSKVKLTQTTTDTQSDMTTEPMTHASMASITRKGLIQLLIGSD